MPLLIPLPTITNLTGGEYGFDGNVNVLQCMPRVYLPRKTRYNLLITGKNKKARVVANDAAFAARKAA